MAALVVGVALIVWGAEQFAANLARAAVGLGVSAFALALLLAGAEPEEMATVIAATLRGAPGIAFGDIVGANIAMCLVALGVGAVVAPLPFTRRVLLYGLASLPVGVLATILMWGGTLGRLQGVVLIGLYALYVGAVWRFEHAPPALGELEELQEAEEQLATVRAAHSPLRVGRELVLVLAGLAALAIGATVLVEATRQITGIEEGQTRLGLTLVGFATAFELVMLCWSAARRGATDVALAGVIGSFAYNVTMSLGAGAVLRPITIADAALLHTPLLLMLGSLVAVLLLAAPRQRLTRPMGIGLLCAYPVVLWLMVR